MRACCGIYKYSICLFCMFLLSILMGFKYRVGLYVWNKWILCVVLEYHHRSSSFRWFLSSVFGFSFAPYPCSGSLWCRRLTVPVQQTGRESAGSCAASGAIRQCVPGPWPTYPPPCPFPARHHRARGADSGLQIVPYWRSPAGRSVSVGQPRAADQRTAAGV